MVIFPVNIKFITEQKNAVSLSLYEEDRLSHFQAIYIF